MGSELETDPLERFGATLLLAAFRRMAVFLEPGEVHSEAILADRLGIVPEYSRLFESLLSILEKAGFLERRGGKVQSLPVLDDLALLAELGDPDRGQAVLVAAHPGLAAHAHCLRHCLDAYPDVLTGRRNHMEVLFPSGSISLVEKIYKGNVQADACSRLVARLVRAYVDERRRLDPAGPVTILEVGAGTGSTSSFVLPALADAGGPLRYLYTDVSAGFLEHGRSSFGAAHPFVEFRLLDLERPAEEQGIPPDSVDLVLGSNVLHATRDIRATLSHVKRPLRANGLLVVNEVTVSHGSATLIFGLTRGWWRFEDEAERLPGSPLLDRARWEALLLEGGFRSIRSFSPAGEAGSELRSQSVIVAESDGLNAGAASPAGSSAGAAPEPVEPPSPSMAEGPVGLPGQDLPGLARSYVKSVFSEVLRIPAGRIGDRATFERYGIDSLVAQELVARFERDLGPLPATLLFEYGTVEALGALLAEGHAEALRRIGGGSGVAAAAATEEEPSVVPRTAAPVPEGRPGGVSRDASRFEVAVVGLAGRYPASPTVPDLWENLRGGRSCIQDVPRDRWDATHESFRGSRSRRGGFLDDVDRFDPLFFGISPAEAERMDPEERLVLETVWHAVEDAGFTRRELSRLAGGVGVYVGCMYRQYPLLARDPGLRGCLSSGSYWSIANRVSYVLDLKGPSLAVDTACSSSLTAVHLACESLRSGECGAAIVAGVNLSLHPGKYLALSEVGLLGSHPESRSLGDGDGMVPGEGVGAVLLRPLREALEEGDFVYGVILATAANHGGKTGGFRVPSPAAQADLVATSLARAGVPARSISCLELAANGSPLGDPIEVAALAKVFGSEAGWNGPCSIGSVKSNLGHLEAASGISQLTKVLCQLQARELVPTLNARPLNPRLDLSSTPFTLQESLAAWDGPPGTPRRAGVSSFGAGGANAHLVVEEGPAPPPEEAPEREELIVLSARDEERLRASAAGLAAHLARFDRPGAHFLAPPALADVAFTLQTGREEMEERLAFVTGSREELCRRLESFAEGGWEGALRGSCEEDSTGFADPESVRGALASRDLAELGRLWVRGVPVDWRALRRTGARRRVSLPGYPFARRRCWLDAPRPAPTVPTSGPGSPGALHPLVHRNTSSFEGISFEATFTGDEFFLGEHVVLGRRVLPAAALVEMARAAGELAARRPVVRLGDLAFLAPLAAPPGEEGCTVEIRLVPGDDGAEFEVVGLPSGSVHASGLLHWDPALSGEPPAEAPRQDGTSRGEVDGDSLYRSFAQAGLSLGERFRTVRSVAAGEGFASAKLGLHAALLAGADGFVLHPALLDGALQAVAGLQDRSSGLSLPFWIDEVEIRRRIPAAAVASVTSSPAASRSGGNARFDVEIRDEAGESVATIRGLSTRPAAAGSLPAAEDPAPPLPGEAGPLADQAERQRVEERLRAVAARMLKMDPSEVPVRRDFTAYGFDSTSLVAFSREVNASEGGAITPADLFEHFSISRLAGHLVSARPREGEAGGSRASLRAPRRRPLPAGRGRGAAPIAIIGASGVLPGSRDLDEFWRHLEAGTDLISEIPPDRWDWRAVWGDPGTEAMKTRAKWGGFMPEVDRFDALFFGISPKEAALMDPQQRLFLTTVWRTIEDAGYRPSDLAKSRTGLWVGVASSDYSELIRARVDDVESQISTGISHAVLANRISFLLDLRGPSEPVDTACSSSLVAIHHAVEALRSGRCDLAIAGGVNVILSPTMAIGFSKAGMMSADGRCKAFSSAADGYVRGEGVGALLLKPLDRALADGDTVRAVILATAAGHGGRAASLTAPNPEAQADLLEEAWRLAGIHPETLGYVEAHGTGTELGDPIEVNGLKSAFARFGPGPDGAPAPTCGLGSVKSNIGHLETASGVAGVLKMVLAMRHRVLPATLHATELNPYLNLDGSPFDVIRERRPWTRRTGRDGREVPRRAGVSSFGFGGANAHVLLEEPDPPPFDREEPEPQLIVVSARNEERLAEAVRGLAGFLGREEESLPPLADLAFTLQVGREEMACRLAFVAGSLADARERLSAPSGLETGRVAVRRGEERAAGAADPEYVEYLVANRKLSKLASLWVAGAAVDWRRLHTAGRRRVPLPTYPFARERHWVGGSVRRSPVAEPALPGGSGHPLLDGSAGDGSRKRLDPREPVVAEHLVGGRPVLPGAASLEMALAAARRARPGENPRLVDVVFVEPVALAGEPVDLEVVLTGEAEAPDFRIESVSPSGRVTHVVGEVRFGTGGADLLPEAEQPRLEPRAGPREGTPPPLLESAEIYRRFREMGVTHGPTYRSLETLSLGDGAASGWLSLPASARDPRFVLSPGLADGAMQVAVLLAFDVERRPMLPFSVAEVSVFRSLPGNPGERLRVRAHRNADGGVDVDVAGEDGLAVFRLRGVRFRELPVERTGLPLYVPLWLPEAGAASVPSPDRPERVSILAGAGGNSLAKALAGLHPGAEILSTDAGEACPAEGVSRVYFLGGIGDGPVPLDDAAAIEAAQERGVLALFRMVRLLAARGDAERTLDLRVITDGVHLVLDRDEGRPTGASLLGLAKSIGLEFPLWSVLSLDVDLAGEGPEGLGELSAALDAERGDASGREIAFREGRRYVRSMHRLEAGGGGRTGLGTPGTGGFREGGTYLIAGAGGIGREVAWYLATSFRARLVLLGRRPASSALTELVAEIERLGGEALSVTADLTDAGSLEEALRRARERFGKIDGAIHSAVVLRDGMLRTMDEAAFREALSPKVTGSVLLARALRAEGTALDFVIFFSSIVGLSGGIGQANYAAATTFEDAFAATLARRGILPSAALAWGYWGTVGGATDERVSRAMAAEGIGSIDPASGMEALSRVAAEPSLGYCVALRAEPAALARLGLPAEEARRDAPVRGGAVPAGEPLERLRQILAGVLQIDRDGLDATTSLEEYGVDSLMALEVVKALEKDFGRVAPSDLFRHPTLESLASFLASRGGAAAPRPVAPREDGATPELPPEIVPINRSGRRRASFWVHGAPGFAGVFRSLASALGKEYPLFAFQARGVDGRALPFMRLPDMAAHYAECVRRAVPRGPYVLGGYSLGGVVAMEAARLLHEAGERVERLVLLDTYPNTPEVEAVFGGLRESGLSRVMLANLFLASENWSQARLTMADLEGVLPHLQLGALVPLIRERGRLSLSEDEVYRCLKGATDVSNFTGEAFRVHAVRPYDASDVLYFRSTRGFVLEGVDPQPASLAAFASYDTVGPWRDVIRTRLEVVEVPCDHFSLLMPPGLDLVAARLSKLLALEGRLAG